MVMEAIERLLAYWGRETQEASFTSVASGERNVWRHGLLAMLIFQCAISNGTLPYPLDPTRLEGRYNVLRCSRLRRSLLHAKGNICAFNAEFSPLTKSMQLETLT